MCISHLTRRQETRRHIERQTERQKQTETDGNRLTEEPLRAAGPVAAQPAVARVVRAGPKGASSVEKVGGRRVESAAAIDPDPDPDGSPGRWGCGRCRRCRRGPAPGRVQITLIKSVDLAGYDGMLHSEAVRARVARGEGTGTQRRRIRVLRTRGRAPSCLARPARACFRPLCRRALRMPVEALDTHERGRRTGQLLGANRPARPERPPRPREAGLARRTCARRRCRAERGGRGDAWLVRAGKRGGVRRGRAMGGRAKKRVGEVKELHRVQRVDRIERVGRATSLRLQALTVIRVGRQVASESARALKGVGVGVRVARERIERIEQGRVGGGECRDGNILIFVTYITSTSIIIIIIIIVIIITNIVIHIVFLQGIGLGVAHQSARAFASDGVEQQRGQLREGLVARSEHGRPALLLLELRHGLHVLGLRVR
jgi:hypothetical protein